MASEIERRIEALEKSFGQTPVILHFGPGTTQRQIKGTTSHFFKLMEAADARMRAQMAGETLPSSIFDADLDAIRDAGSIDSTDHLHEMLQGRLRGPVARGVLNPD